VGRRGGVLAGGAPERLRRLDGVCARVVFNGSRARARAMGSGRRYARARALAGAAVLLASQSAAQAAPAPRGDVANLAPLPSLTESNSTETAYQYAVNPFHCDQPTVSVDVNASYTTVTLVYYNEARQDALGAVPVNRTTFTYATWYKPLAQQPLNWDPSNWLDASNNPALSGAYGYAPSGSSPLSQDRYLYRGVCNPSASTTFFPKVSNLTQAYPQAALDLSSGNKYTPDFYTASANALTPQATGCACVAFVYDAVNGLILPVADQAGATSASYGCLTAASSAMAGMTDNADARKVFWTAQLSGQNVRPSLTTFNSTFLTNGWAVRQSNCPGGASYCSGYKFAPQLAASGASACGVRTEAKFVTQTSTLGDLPFVTGGSAGVGGTGQQTFSLFTVEVGSSYNFSNSTYWPVDTFQSRVLEHKFQINTNQYGAVVIPIQAGDVLPPLLSRLRSTSITRDPVLSYQADVEFLLTTYVRQPGTWAPGNISAATDAGLLFMQSAAGLVPGAPSATAFFTPTATVSGGAFVAQCDQLAPVAAGQVVTSGAGMGSQFGCKLGASAAGAGNTAGSCGVMLQTQLPSYITANFNPSAMSVPYYWMPYDVTIKCRFTAQDHSITANRTLSVPSTTMSFDYGIAYGGNANPVTDQLAPPAISFNTYFTVEAEITNTTSFPLVGSVVQLSEASIANDATLSQIVYDNEANSVAGAHAFAYSEALAFKVQLRDLATRAQWQVIPALTLLVAFQNSSVGTSSSDASAGVPLNAGSVTSQWRSFGGQTGGQLTASWCGLNRPDRVAAFVFNNSAANVADGLTAPQLSNGLITGLGVYGNMQNAFSTALNQELAALIAYNSYSNVSLFQGNIFPTATGSADQTRVFNVPDATGGFAVPLRNRLRVNGQIGTYTVQFCALTEVMAYNASVRNGWFPLYTTAAAATADTLSVGGALAAPFMVFGSNFVGGYSAAANPGAAVAYYMPQKPASTNGVLCVPSGHLGDQVQVSGTATKVSLSAGGGAPTVNTFAPCTSLIAGTTSIYARRRLMGADAEGGPRRSLMQAVSMSVSPSAVQQLLTQASTTPPAVQFQTAPAPVSVRTTAVPAGAVPNNSLTAPLPTFPPPVPAAQDCNYTNAIAIGSFAGCKYNCSTNPAVVEMYVAQDNVPAYFDWVCLNLLPSPPGIAIHAPAKFSSTAVAVLALGFAGVAAVPLSYGCAYFNKKNDSNKRMIANARTPGMGPPTGTRGWKQ
jgi:hypothetical protein